MQLRMVRLGGGQRSVAVWANENWVPLAALPGSAQLGAATSDLLVFLGGGAGSRAQTEDPLARVPAPPLDVVRWEGGLPFRPTGFRDCSLWEQHLVDSARALLGLHGGPVRLAARSYERLLRRPFPPLRPRPLWHEKPLYYKGTVRWLHRRWRYRAVAGVDPGIGL